MWEKPTSEGTIEKMLGLNDVKWSQIYILARRITVDSYSRQFFFKLTHNILFLNKALKRMRLVESSMCSYCNLAEETPIHFFAECQFVIRLWNQIQSFFGSCLNLPEITPQSAILGWYQEEDRKILKNQILLTFKMVLYKDKELRRCSIDRVINKLKMVKTIEHAISTNRDYNTAKWDPIMELLG